MGEFLPRLEFLKVFILGEIKIAIKINKELKTLINLCDLSNDFKLDIERHEF
jgi:hypothetical protein